MEPSVEPVNRMFRSRRFMGYALLTAIVYFALLLPFQTLYSLGALTEVRPAAFLPVAAGIYFGPAAALGIFIGNLAGDCLTRGFETASFILSLCGSATNAAVAIAAWLLWYRVSTKHDRRGMFVVDVATYVKYLVIVACLWSPACSLFALLSRYASGSNFASTWLLLFFNDVEFSVLLGLPLLLLLPRTRLCCWLPTSHAPLAQEDDEFLRSSVRVRIITWLSLTNTFLSLALGILVYVLTEHMEPGFYQHWYLVYSVCAITTTCVTLVTIVTLRLVERIATDRLYRLALMSGAGSGDELDVLESRLDFIVAPKDGGTILRDSHSLFIGLADKDGGENIDPETARRIVGEACLHHVDGYFTTETGDAQGGYRGKGGEIVHEKTLIYTIFGAAPEQIDAIAHDVLRELNQESILVERNGTLHYLVYA